MEYARFRVEYTQYSPSMIRDIKSPLHISFAEISTNMPELIEDLPRKLSRDLNLSDPNLFSIKLRKPKNNLPCNFLLISVSDGNPIALFEIEINEDLNIIGSFKKTSDLVWKRIDRREMVKANSRGLYLKIRGLRGRLSLMLKVIPLNFCLKAKPKLMSISKDQHEYSESNRLEKLSFDKNGARLQKLKGRRKRNNRGEPSQPNLFHYLGKRKQKEDKLSFDGEKENFFFDVNTKRIKVVTPQKPHREYFDLRSFYQSGKGSVKVKNVFYEDDQDIFNQNKMTKSVQKIDYNPNNKLTRVNFISPLKTVKKGRKEKPEFHIKAFNEKKIDKAPLIFDKTPSREENQVMVQEPINSPGDLKCHLCLEKKDNIDMLKCGHIVCLDCILKENMTYSECKICDGKAQAHLPQERVNELEHNHNRIETPCESVKVISVNKIDLEKLGFMPKNLRESEEVEFIEKSTFEKKNFVSLKRKRKSTPMTVETKCALVDRMDLEDKFEVKKVKKRTRMNKQKADRDRRWKATKFPKKKEKKGKKKNLKIKLCKDPSNDNVEARSYRSLSGKASPIAKIIK